MNTWQYEIVTGTVDEVRDKLNRLGALNWEIVSTGVLPESGAAPELIVYLKRSANPEAAEPHDATLHELPPLRASPSQ